MENLALGFKKRKRLYIFILVSIGVAFITLFLTWKLTPWFYSINAHVRLYMDAPAETKISICWDRERAECLPLVPYSPSANRLAQTGETAQVWIGELPPRPMYSISLVFNSEVEKASFQKLILDSSGLLLFGHVQGAGIDHLVINANQFAPHKISSELANDFEYINANKGGWLTLNGEIYSGPPGVSSARTTSILVWGLLFSIYLLAAIPVYLLPRAILNLSSANKQDQPPRYSWWVFILFGGAAALMLLLVVKSGVLFNEFDPLNYMYLATGGRWFSDTRLPGYPFFLDMALELFHYQLNGVIFLQAIILVFSVLFCVWVLRKWIPQFAAILFVILCLFSPAQIHWARWILRESLFASLVLLTSTAAIAHFTSRKPHSDTWFLVFTTICSIAFLVRENGLILPVAVLPVLVPELITLFASSRPLLARMRSALFLVARYSIPVVVLAIIYTTFAGYNYLHYGYFQIGIHQTSHDFLAKAIYPGNADARGLFYPSDSNNAEGKSYLGWIPYSSYILARDQTPGLDPVYTSLYQTVNQQMYERGQAKNTFHLAAILNEMGISMNAFVPQRAQFAGILRQYSEIVSLRANVVYPLQVGDRTTKDSKQELLNRLPVKISLDENTIDSDGILAGYFKATQGYPWYGLILILATLSSIYILKYDDPVFLIPMVVFVANCILLLITRLVEQRYLVSLDVLLILQMALGLSSWMRKNHLLKPPAATYIVEKSTIQVNGD